MENTQDHHKQKRLIEQDPLRELLSRRCMSQKEIADEIGTNNVYLNDFLNRKRVMGIKFEKKIKAWLEK